MLVYTHRVEPHIGGEFHLVEEVVVHVVCPFGVEQLRIDSDPDGFVLLFEIIR